MIQNAPRGCAARGVEGYVEHTARARKCAVKRTLYLKKNTRENTRKKEEKMKNDTFTLGGKEFSSRFILGSGKYSMELIKAAVENAGAQIITLAVRRTNTKKKENILDFIPDNVTLLPNTSGARDAKEAVRIARMARELGCGDFVKVEIMKDSKYLLPDNVETVKATEMLAKKDLWCFHTCIRICIPHVIWSMPEPQLLCHWRLRSVLIKVWQRKNLSRF